MKRKQIQKQMQAQPQVPVNTADSNAKADRLCTCLFYALIVASISLFGGGVYFATTNFIASLNRVPTDWNGILLMTLCLAASVLLSRALFWLSFFGTTMLAARSGAWKTGEATCLRAMKLPRSLSRGTTWASLALIQSLVSRGKYTEALKEADEEWARSGEDVREVHNLGPLCVTAGMASQLAEDGLKDSLKWNERGIECLNKAVEDLAKPKKGFFAKTIAAAPQSTELLGQLRQQLAVAHFNVASIYFSKNDYRRAKEQFKKAVDNAGQAPDFPQKSDIIKHARDQLGRLKHH